MGKKKAISTLGGRIILGWGYWEIQQLKKKVLT